MWCGLTSFLSLFCIYWGVVLMADWGGVWVVVCLFFDGDELRFFRFTVANVGDFGRVVPSEFVVLTIPNMQPNA